jgi:hypothetical protein
MKTAGQMFAAAMGAYSRRQILKRAGGAAAAAGALAAFPAAAAAENDPNDPTGLWGGVVSASDNSFPPFNVWSLWGAGILIASGNQDLTPAGLSSSALATWKKISPGMFRSIQRVWVYSAPPAAPAGSLGVNLTFTLHFDGKTMHGVGTVQFYDTTGTPQGPPTPITTDATRIA